MSVFMIILDWLCWIYVVEFLPICRDLEIFMMMYIDLMTCIFWRCMTFIRCDCWGILYMHVVSFFVWRRSVYFLNICFIRVFYRFNRNRALHHVLKKTTMEVNIGQYIVNLKTLLLIHIGFQQISTI